MSRLAEIGNLVEILNGEEQQDNLPNLKDNKLIPALARLSRDVDQFVGPQAEDGALSAPAIAKLTTAIFGDSYLDDRKTARVGTDGLYCLYVLRRDTLLLRSEREKLNSERSTLSHDIDAVVGAFTQSARAQSEALAAQLEQNLASSWRRMMIAGGGCSALFIWLAWWISWTVW